MLMHLVQYPEVSNQEDWKENKLKTAIYYQAWFLFAIT